MTFISISSFCFRISSNGPKHGVFDISLADLENDEDQAHRKIMHFLKRPFVSLGQFGLLPNYFLVIP